MEPNSAVLNVRKWLNLSENEKELLLDSLLCEGEATILVVKMNPAWLASHRPGTDTAVIDALAFLKVQKSVRRDAKAPGFIFHFKTSQEKNDVKDLIRQMHPVAFSLGPMSAAAVKPAIDAGFKVNVEPMAFTAVIHKLGIRKHDAESSQFFYLDS